MNQLALDLSYRAAFGREDFMVADCNAEAVAWIERWREWPLGRFALFGPPGCGKTHLLHVWREESGSEPLSLQDLEADDLDQRVAGNPCLAIDAADMIAGDAGRERALFHLINLAGEAGASLLLVGREAPARWQVSLPDLRSRLAATASVAIMPPDDSLMAALLVKLFADRQAPLDSDAVAYLVPRMERSFASARDLVRRLDRVALAERRRVTVPVARRVLAEIAAEQDDG